mmetsp:Transcript_10741/g.29202  ORF Transcript_10741/g.29202 Transcript_10741/m.29202 type:complete len:389 (+) Transcript_10741:213-1379(+)
MSFSKSLSIESAPRESAPGASWSTSLASAPAPPAGAAAAAPLPGAKPTPSISSSVSLPRGCWANFTPGTRSSAMWMAVLACMDNSPTSSRDLPAARDAGRISWSARCTSTAAPEASCAARCCAASVAALVQAPGRSSLAPLPLLLPVAYMSRGSTDPWNSAPAVVSTTMSTQNLCVLSSGARTWQALTSTRGASCATARSTAATAAPSRGPSGLLEYRMASARAASPLSEKSSGLSGPPSAGTDSCTCPPPLGKKPRVGHSSETLAPMRSTTGRSTLRRKSNGGLKATSVPPRRQAREAPPASSSGKSEACAMSVMAPAVPGSAEKLPGARAPGVSVTSHEPTKSLVSCPADTSRTSRNDSRCCAASPGLERPARIFVMCIGMPNRAE